MRQVLADTYHAALQAVSPARLLRGHWPPQAPQFILAVGKAALPMARAALDAYPGTPALVVPPAGGADARNDDVPTSARVLPGTHPLPSQASVQAAEEALAQLSRLTAAQSALVLLSGGGSALLCAPEGVTLAQKQALSRDLMRAGADIYELNTVRKHLSRVKGGALAASTRAHLHCLLLSDVVGDDPSVIASGPTVPDPTTRADAVAVLDKYGIRAPEARAHLLAGGRETPKTLPHVTTRVIGSNGLLLEAAQAYLTSQGVKAVVLTDTFQGETRDVAHIHWILASYMLRQGTPFRPPAVLISGGETTVTVRGTGQGGRNQEFALWLLQELRDLGVFALVAGSDGIDGTSHAAGAFLTPDSWARALATGLDPAAFLENNDSATFFARLNDQFVTGPTGHNLNDLRLIAVGFPP